MTHYIHCGINCIRLITLYSLLIALGYILGNTWPTFEVKALDAHERWLAEVDPAMNAKIENMGAEFIDDEEFKK